MRITTTRTFYLFTRNKTKKVTSMNIGLIFCLLIIFCILPFHSALANEWFYTVRPGDNLWNISDRYLTKKEYSQQLLKLNQIKNPGDLQPGTKLRIPIIWMKHQPSSSRIINAKGKVTIIRAAGPQPTSTDDNIHLFVGDSIITGVDGNATLEFADKSRLLIQPNSELVMDTLSTYGDKGMVDTRLRLPSGRVETQVTPKKKPGSRYEIITPTAVAAVRGTDFRVSADTALSRSEVLEGKVAVSGNNHARNILSGYGTVTESGKPPIEPKKLLPAPDTTGTQKALTQFPIKFTWEMVTNAVSYRAQIYPSANNKSLLIDKPTDTASIQINQLPDNDYLLRVRAVDNLGLEGLNQDHFFTVNVQPKHPDIIQPANNAVSRDILPLFSWSAVKKVNQYHVQIAEDNTFNKLLYDIPANHGNLYQPSDPLPEKILYWRVASVDSDGFDGPFSETMMVQIKPLPGVPEISQVIVDKNKMTYYWKKTGKKLLYQVQMATDSKFENILLRTSTLDNNLIIPRPSSNIYYYRIRAITQNGETSEFSQFTLIHVRPLNYNTSTQP